MQRRGAQRVPPVMRGGPPLKGSAVTAFLLILAASFLVYGNALTNPFVIDDKIVILGDTRVQEGRFGELLSGHYWPEARSNLLYRPLVSASFALNWMISHEAWTFRLVNLLLHGGTGFVVFLLVRSLSLGDQRCQGPAHDDQPRQGLVRSWIGGLVAGLLFVIHPVHTSVLNQIVDRAEIGAAFFGLLAVWLFWTSAADQRNGRRVRLSLAIVSFAAALFCKENAITLVGVVLLLDALRSRLRHERTGRRWWASRALCCYLPLVLVVAGYLAVRSMALGDIARGSEDVPVVDNIIANPTYGLEAESAAWLARWGTPVACFGKAVNLMLWPHPLSWDYSYAAIDPVAGPADAEFLAGLFWLMAIAVLIALSIRRHPALLVGPAFFLIAYSIVSNTYIVIGTAFAERFLYLPSVGFCMLIGVLAAAIFRPISTLKRNARLAALAGGVTLFAAVAITCGFLTIRRNIDFAEERLLNAKDLLAQPRSCRLWCAVATDVFNERDYAKCLDHVTLSLRICPEYATAWRLAGLAYQQAGDYRKGLEALDRFFAMGGRSDERAMLAAASMRQATGDSSGAIEALTELLEHRPDSVDGHNNLAWYLIQAKPPELRDPGRALRHASRALELAPDAGDVLDTYVSVLLAAGRRIEAIDALKRHLPMLKPGDAFERDLEAKLDELQRSSP